MKFLYTVKTIFLLGLICLATATHAQFSNTDLELYYPFNGNANDASSNTNNGIVTGATLTSDRFGNANSAYSFDGTNDYIIIDGAGTFTDYSVSLWFKTTQTTFNQSWKSGILFSDNHAAGSNALGRPCIYMKNTGSVASTPGYNGPPPYTAPYIELIDPDGTADGQWHMATITINATATEHKFYVDGILISNQTTYVQPLILSNSGTSGTRVEIGAKVEKQEFFDGSLDDIEIYSRVLTDCEVMGQFLDGSPIASQTESHTICSGSDYTFPDGTTQTNITTTTVYTSNFPSVATGCDSAVIETTLNIAGSGSLNLSIAATNESCASTSDGALDATVSGGATPYTYSWSTGSSNQDLVGLTAGTYTLSVNDAAGCATSSSADVLTVSSSIGVPDLQATSCGITLSTLGEYIYCEAVAGADRYQYEVTGGGTTQQGWSHQAYPGSRFFSLSWVPGVAIATTYSIRVRARVAGCWGAYGNICTVNTPGVIPTTSLTAADCNSTASALNDYFRIDAVHGAQQYEYEILDGSGFSSTVSTFSWLPTATWFSLSFVNGIEYATTYSIRVRAQVGGVWGAYGPTCTLTTPALAPPTIQASYCGSTLLSKGQFFYTNQEPGAQRYQYNISDGAGFSTTGFSYWGKPSANWFSFSLVPGIQSSTSYDVSVRVKIAGSWGNYGPNCSISTPSAKMEAVGSTTTSALQAHVFPNPNSGQCSVAIGAGIENATMQVTDLMGRVVYTQQNMDSGTHALNLGAQPKGLYILVLTSGANRAVQRIVVN